MKKLNIGILAFSGLVFLNSCGTTKTGETQKPETMKNVVAEQVKKEVKKKDSIYLIWIKLFVPDDFLAM
jgi:putative endopeptidase